MDKELFEKYKVKAVPFDGKTTYLKTNIAINDLRKVVDEVVEFLRQNNLIHTDIFRVWDWLEHDGYLPDKELITQDFLFKLLKDDEAFYLHRSEDTYVNLGLCDENFNWYLRIYIIDDFDLNEGEERSGSFSISLSDVNSKALNKELNFNNKIQILDMNTFDYFKSIIV